MSITADKNQKIIERPLVSIIMPTYNREKYLKEAIDSALNQTYKNLELFVIDDGSTDDTKSLVQQYQIDERFYYTYQENQGQSAARNAGIKQSRGKYVCFLDSDNRWLLNKLERQVPIMESSPEIDVLYGLNYAIDEAGNRLPNVKIRMKAFSGQILDKLLLFDNFISNNTTIVRKNCFDEMGGFDDKERGAEDYELWLRFATRYSFLHIEDIYGEYRYMDDQISSDKEFRFSSNEKILKKFLESNQDLISEKVKRMTWCRFYSRAGRYYLSIGEKSKARQNILNALCAAPLSSIPWRGLIKLGFSNE